MLSAQSGAVQKKQKRFFSVGEDGFARLRTGQVGGKTCRWHVFLHASPSNPSSQRPIHSKKHHPFGWCFLLVGEDGFARLRTGRLAALERPRRSIHFRSASNPSSQRPIPNKNTAFTGGAFAWWGKMDSNHRRHCQQIYSLQKTLYFQHLRPTVQQFLHHFRHRFRKFSDILLFVFRSELCIYLHRRCDVGVT